MKDQPEIKPLIVEGAVDVSRALKFWEKQSKVVETLKEDLELLDVFMFRGKKCKLGRLMDLIEEIESI